MTEKGLEHTTDLTLLCDGKVIENYFAFNFKYRQI